MVIYFNFSWSDSLTQGLPDLICEDDVQCVLIFNTSYVGIELAIAYLLGTQMTTSLKWRQKFWQIVMFLLISIGVVSGTISSQAEAAWSKNRSITKHYPKIAQVINQAESPLIVSDVTATSILSLSYLLNPNVKLQLVLQPNVLHIPQNFSDVFLFDTSDALLQKVQQEADAKLEVVAGAKDAKLWKLMPVTNATK